MKAVNSYIFRAVCALLVGLLLVANPERMTTLMVQVIGGLFLISGLVSIINYFVIRYSDKETVKPFFPSSAWAVFCSVSCWVFIRAVLSLR